MAMWPAYLPPFVSAEDYAEGWIDGVVRTDMLMGPPRTRRRFTRARRTFRRSFLLRGAQYDAWWKYFDVDLAAGARQFEVVHPISKEIVKLKLSAPPSVSPVGVDAFYVSLDAEEQ